MSESAPSSAASLTPDSAKQLPDRELIASHDEAETIAQHEPASRSAEAVQKVSVAEEELKRRGTSTN